MIHAEAIKKIKAKHGHYIGKEGNEIKIFDPLIESGEIE